MVSHNLKAKCKKGDRSVVTTVLDLNECIANSFGNLVVCPLPSMSEMFQGFKLIWGSLNS